jgi:hypothetical protein
MAPPGAPAQAAGMAEILEDSRPLLLGSTSQGYLGVWVDDVDKEKADTLKLKEVRGAVITIIDHDAPAGQVGLKVNDVVLGLNGQPVEGAEQLKRMLREIPPGRKVTLEISRDGATQTLIAQLADHKKMVEGFWTRIGNGTSELLPTVPLQGEGILPDGDVPTVHESASIFGGGLKVGATVEPLSSQMADNLGVPSGLMVRQVANKSEAAAAGLKAWDVILKVGADSIATLSDWARALRANQGKPVQLTVLRDKKQQILTMKVDSKHTRGELEFDGIFSDDDCPILAELEPDAAQVFRWDSEDAAKALSAQAEALKDQLLSGDMKQFEVSPQQAEEFRKQAEQLRDSLKGFDFKIDPKQMEEFRRQMDEWRKNFQPQDFHFDQKQFDELKRQFEEMRERGSGTHV